MKILSLLLKYNYCVGALAKAAKLSKFKVLYEAELLINNKRAYFMYYSVNQSVLNKL
jgi:ArsR family transcriptional regulator